MENRVLSLEARMTRLEHVILGNGEAGLDERVRNATARLDADLAAIAELRADVRTLIARKEREDAEREGSRRTLAQVRTIGIALLALLGVGGGVGLSRVLGALEALGGLP